MVKAGAALAALWMVLVALQQTLSGRGKPVRSGLRTGCPDQNVAPAFTM
jgi:hypothetical protein